LRVRADPIPIILAMLEATSISRGIILKQLLTDEFCITWHTRIWNSSVGIVTRLDEQGNKVWFLEGARNCCLLHSIHPSSHAYLTSYLMHTRGCFTGEKWQGLKYTTILITVKPYLRSSRCLQGIVLS
jgi:hypothetical protein